ncbi:MAG: hypothetical protein QNK37_16875 [Acidobacteriota bacterium]|nr:hypothetical protein [Acidobacteriota bacterium]
MSRSLYILIFMLNPVFLPGQTGLDGITQCNAERLDTLLVSDRFEDAVQFGEQLILANAHGLIFLDVTDITRDPILIEPLSGEVIAVQLDGNRLWAAVRGVGLYQYTYDEDEDEVLPAQTGFFNVPGLLSVTVVGDVIMALTETGLRYLRIDPLQIVDTLQMEGLDIRANENMVFVRGFDAHVTMLRYDEQGFVDEGEFLEVDDSRIFYGMEYAGDALVVDTLNGVKWLTFDEQGERTDEGFYFENQGSNIVFGFDVNDSRITLSFANRIEVHTYDISRRTTYRGQISQQFRDVGITKIRTENNHLHLLNSAVTGRDWSLDSYSLSADTPTRLARLPARFRDVADAAVIGDQIYFAVDRLLQTLSPDNELNTLETLDGQILFLVASGEYLLAVFSDKDSQTGLQLFRSGEEGLTQVLRESIEGNVQDLTQYQGQFAFTRTFRTISEARYTVFTLETDGETVELIETLDAQTEIGEPNPFGFLQLGERGLVYWDRERLWIKALGEQDPQPFILDLGVEESLIALAAPGPQFWIETEQGLLIAEPQRQTVQVLGRHPNWTNLGRQNSNLILAVNKLQGPTRYHVMGRRDGLAYSMLSFETSSGPTLVTDRNGDLLVAEPTSVSSHIYGCPLPDIQYQLPLDNRLELDLSTDLQPSDAAVLSIFNRNGELIGLQTLTPSVIGLLNGNTVRNWLFDYNRLETAHAVVLNSSVAMGPVISGRAISSNTNSRFALQLPSWQENEFYVPHIPNDFNNWDTRVAVNTFNASGGDSLIYLESAFNDSKAEITDFGSPVEFRIDQDTFIPPTRWARVTSDDLNVNLNGFTQIQAPSRGLAAAVPLIGELAGSLFVPFLAGKDNPGWWTGLVMANPHPTDVKVRIFGYNKQGERGIDRTLDLPAKDTLVVPAEAWIEDFVPDADIQWLALVSELPITGMTLFATVNPGQLAGLPLATSPSERILCTGIRSNSEWNTSLVITTINLERAVLKLTAVGRDGRELEVRGWEIPSRAILQRNVRDLFNLSDQLPNVHTIRVESNTEVIGFIFRNQRGTGSLEAVSAIVDTVAR